MCKNGYCTTVNLNLYKLSLSVKYKLPVDHSGSLSWTAATLRLLIQQEPSERPQRKALMYNRHDVDGPTGRGGRGGGAQVERNRVKLSLCRQKTRP